MSFQQVINIQQAYGVPGTYFLNSPYRASSYILNSASSSLNIVGATAYTQTTQGLAVAGGTGVYLGILANPHTVPLTGVASSPLTPSLVVANGIQAEIVNMGDMVVTLPAPAAIGDVVIFDQTTGALSTITPGTSLPSGKTYANANVIQYSVTAAGIAVIRLTTELFV